MRRALLSLLLLAACAEPPARLTRADFDGPTCQGGCDDGDPCTVDSCDAGACTHAPLACDDGDPCTDDGCGAGGCAHAEAVCDDGDPCTDDRCGPGGCAADPADCDDGDPCTADSCDAAAGCTHAALGCDDGDACTTDACGPGGCTHEAVGCDDGDVCTTDACDPATGCVTSPGDGPCDDGDPCTGGDACADGACGGVALDCEDGDACTEGSCDPGSGCVQSVVPCDDGDPCTVDSCDAAEGCGHEAVEGCATPLPGWAAARDVAPFEPAHGGDGSVTSLLDAEHPGGASSRARVDEPLELPLRMGVPSDVLVYLPFDGTFDGILPDDVEVYSESSTFEDGKVGQSVRPDPRITLVPPAPDGGPFTIALWARSDLLAGTIPVMGLYSPKGSGLLPVNVRISQGQWSASVSGPPVVLGQAVQDWQHVAVVVDPVGGNGGVWLDGRLVKHLAPTPIAFGGTTLEIGPPGTVTGKSLVRVDEVIYANRALDGAEIEALVRSGRPFGSTLVEADAQPDWDDARVTVAGTDEELPSEVVGRRPQSDSAADGVAVCWPMDGDLLPSVGQAASTAGAVEEQDGAFGLGGALRFADGATRLWTDRAAPLEPPFAVEAWVRSSEIAPCGAGAVLLRTGAGDAGFTLRLCDGVPRFELAGAGTTVLDGHRSVADGRWHHLLASVEAGGVSLFVDGGPEGEAPLAGAPSDDLAALQVAPDGADLALDDLCVHRVARGAGWAYRRVWPAAPTVRVLVGTEPAEGPYPLPALRVHAGNAAAGAPQGCSDLLACAGTVGLWRFERHVGPGGALVPDETGAGRHLAAVGVTAASPGGRAVVLAEPALLDAGLLGADAWTVEARVRLDLLPAALLHEEEGLLLRVGEGTGVGTLTGETGGAVVAAPEPVLTGVWAAVGAYAADGLLTVFHGDARESAPSAPGVGGGPLHVGGAADGSEPLTGVVDLLRIMDRALTPDELLAPVPLGWRLAE